MRSLFVSSIVFSSAFLESNAVSTSVARHSRSLNQIQIQKSTHKLELKKSKTSIKSHSQSKLAASKTHSRKKSLDVFDDDDKASKENDDVTTESESETTDASESSDDSTVSEPESDSIPATKPDSSDILAMPLKKSDSEAVTQSTDSTTVTKPADSEADAGSAPLLPANDPDSLDLNEEPAAVVDSFMPHCIAHLIKLTDVIDSEYTHIQTQNALESHCKLAATQPTVFDDGFVSQGSCLHFAEEVADARALYIEAGKGDHHNAKKGFEKVCMGLWLEKNPIPAPKVEIPVVVERLKMITALIILLAGGVAVVAVNIVLVKS